MPDMWSVFDLFRTDKRTDGSRQKADIDPSFDFESIAT